MVTRAGFTVIARAEAMIIVVGCRARARAGPVRQNRNVSYPVYVVYKIYGCMQPII